MRVTRARASSEGCCGGSDGTSPFDDQCTRRVAWRTSASPPSSACVASRCRFGRCAGASPPRPPTNSIASPIRLRRNRRRSLPVSQIGNGACCCIRVSIFSFTTSPRAERVLEACRPLTVTRSPPCRTSISRSLSGASRRRGPAREMAVATSSPPLHSSASSNGTTLALYVGSCNTRRPRQRAQPRWFPQTRRCADTASDTKPRRRCLGKSPPDGGEPGGSRVARRATAAVGAQRAA